MALTKASSALTSHTCSWTSIPSLTMCSAYHKKIKINEPWAVNTRLEFLPWGSACFCLLLLIFSYLLHPVWPLWTWSSLQFLLHSQTLESLNNHGESQMLDKPMIKCVINWHIYGIKHILPVELLRCALLQFQSTQYLWIFLLVFSLPKDSSTALLCLHVFICLIKVSTSA